MVAGGGPRGARRRRRAAEVMRAAGFYAVAIVVMLPAAFVFYWMGTLSLKTQVEAAGYPPHFFRFAVTFRNYVEVFAKNPFLLYVWNSLVVATGSTLIGLIVGLPAAFSIARWRQGGLALAILVARIVPAISYLIPWYILFRNLHMVDTYQALIVTHLVVGLPLIIWVMVGFFEDIPLELDDAAMIDGCSYYGVFRRVAVPLVKPGIMAAAILSFIFSWNNFLFSVILAGRSTRTLPIAVFNMINYEEISWGPLAAAATMITLPVIVLTLLVQRHIVSGLTLGAVKR
jgi:multiple sugar transport system permease protein